MKSIIEDIKNNTYKPVYLLYGEEAYLKKQYKDKLRQALSAPDDTMNYSYYEGKDTNAKAVIDLAATMPFLAERRLIIMENTGYFKSANEDMTAFMKEIPETTCMVFVEQEVDKRSRMFKAVKDAGRVVEMVRQDENTLKRWILGILKRENMNLTEQTLNLFLQMTGDDMDHIEKELEKLICYCMGRDSITSADVEAVCAARVTNKIFDMINAIAEKRQEEALALYNDLLTLKEPPMRILFLIARQFNLLMQVKEMKAAGSNQQAIAEKTGLHGFIVGKYITQSGKFTRQMLREAVEACVDAEEAVKTGRMNDIMSVELLIIKYSSQSNNNHFK